MDKDILGFGFDQILFHFEINLINEEKYELRGFNPGFIISNRFVKDEDKYRAFCENNFDSKFKSLYSIEGDYALKLSCGCIVIMGKIRLEVDLFKSDLITKSEISTIISEMREKDAKYSEYNMECEIRKYDGGPRKNANVMIKFAYNRGSLMVSEISIGVSQKNADLWMKHLALTCRQNTPLQYLLK